LIVEDSAEDYELLVRHLSRGGYRLTSRRVETAEAMRAALLFETWDIVISDWALPRFSALDALALVRESGAGFPFIIVSGAIDDDVAVEALRGGAHDFMSKGRMARLLPAVERELRDARGRAERTRMREQLEISERMASIGMLAAGIAHEVNNPLAAIVANLELVCFEIETLPRTTTAATVVDELRDAHAAAMQIRDIVADLALFSRSARDAISTVDVHRVLDSTLRIATNEIRHRARLVRRFSPVPTVEANESRLGQVFLNLVMNAAQAIPVGHADAHEICVSTSIGANGRVVVEFRDTGGGISPEIRGRLFMPFVTTKPPGVGAGLGLSICHRIVTALGGEITVESQVGLGSKFRVHIPASCRQAIAIVPAESEPMAPVRPGRVLIVDDNVQFAGALQSLLQREHDVVVRHRGDAVLELLRDGERFDVVVCDVMMPEMTGIELFEAMRATWPDQADAVVFASGGAFTDDARMFLERLPNPKLTKPFEIETLAALINERLR